MSTKKQLTKEQVEQDFYKHFQLGIEVEGSFLMEQSELSTNLEGANTEITYDSSINSISEGGYNYELRTGIITALDEEGGFLDGLRKISSDYNGDMIFAYRNNSAGTHIHVDILESIKSDTLTSQAMLVFDSVDFERFFFKEYFQRFSKQKFAERLRNSYCKTYLRDVRNEQAEGVLSHVESVKGDRDRYYWLNTQCLTSDKGIELRIFPYLQTADGMMEVIAFTKKTMLTYWLKPKTQRRVRLIEKYYAHLSTSQLNMGKLTEYEKILVTALNIQGRRATRHSSDSIEFLMDLYAKKPSAFIGIDIMPF